MKWLHILSIWNSLRPCDKHFAFLARWFSASFVNKVLFFVRSSKLLVPLKLDSFSILLPKKDKLIALLNTQLAVDYVAEWMLVFTGSGSRFQLPDIKWSVCVLAMYHSSIGVGLHFLIWTICSKCKCQKLERGCNAALICTSEAALKYTTESDTLVRLGWLCPFKTGSNIIPVSQACFHRRVHGLSQVTAPWIWSMEEKPYKSTWKSRYWQSIPLMGRKEKFQGG